MKILIISIAMLLMLFYIAIAQEQATAQVSLTIEPYQKPQNNLLSKTNITLSILIFLTIFWIKYGLPINVDAINALNIKNVGRKNPSPKYEKGTVITSHKGP